MRQPPVDHLLLQEVPDLTRMLQARSTPILVPFFTFSNFYKQNDKKTFLNQKSSIIPNILIMQHLMVPYRF